MNSQFKKGILELVVLAILNRQDQYGFQLVDTIPKEISISEGTIYPLLKRLKDDGYLETYLIESRDGPVRKYYRITIKGRNMFYSELQDWISFDNAVNSILRR